MSLKFQDPDRQLAYVTFLNRENNFRHHYYDEELKQYRLLQAGDPAAVEESQRMMTSDTTGHLSDDPVRNMKYLFVANITLATRFAIEGGLDSETAYNINDMYIQKMDACRTVAAVLDVHREMFSYFTAQMAGLAKKKIISPAIALCTDFIDLHLHKKIRMADLEALTNLTASYLSMLFKREIGITVTDYILNRRIETAKNMLLNSKFNVTEISEILAFGSQSYFIKVFRRATGLTPVKFKEKFFRKGLCAASNCCQK